MGCCCSRIPIITHRSPINVKKINLMMLGLDGAGKTTIVKNICNENVENTAPTIGFLPYDLQEKDCNVSIYDVGGGAKFRSVWQRYYADVHGIIFVVDSYDEARLIECRLVLTSVLKNPRIRGKPILVFANKQDLNGALDEIDIVEKLQLERLVNQQRCPTLVELCSAVKIVKKKKDSEIHNGLRWLLRNIIKDYPSLNNRVLVDMASEDDAEEVAMKERRRKLEILREKQAYEAELDQAEEIEEVDPFKPISQLVPKEHQNGTIPSLPPIATDNAEDDDDDVIYSRLKGSSNHSQHFFSSQDWSSTTELLESVTIMKPKGFMQRPKSSGAVDFKGRKKRKKRTRLRKKGNRTAPQPMVDFTSIQRPIPAIFDPSFQTEVTAFHDAMGNPGKSSEELILNASDLSRQI